LSEPTLLDLERASKFSRSLIRILKEFAERNRRITPTSLREALITERILQELLRYDSPEARKALAEIDSSEHLQGFKALFVEIVDSFNSIISREYGEEFSLLRTQIEACRDLEGLLSLRHRIVAFLHLCEQQVAHQRAQYTGLFAEIGRNLLEIEGKFQASLASTQDSFQHNTRFNSLLEGQMQDIGQFLEGNPDLHKLRQFVLAKLESIKSALEKKRREDEQQMAELNRHMSMLLQSLHRMRNEVEQAHRKSNILARQVYLDPLTEVHNRRAFERRIREELSRFHRYGQRFSLILIDADHFKRINDQFGHRAGDRCLKEMVRRIQKVLRESDFLARYGGEEFVVILPGTDGNAAFSTGERLRRLVEKTGFLYRDETIPLTVSLGITEVRESDRSPEKLFERVDRAMYTAKESGRNRSILG